MKVNIAIYYKCGIIKEDEKRGSKVYYKEICEVLGLSTKSFYNKYSGKTEYKLSEIITLMHHFNLSFNELIKIIKGNDNGKDCVSDKCNKQT